ncbi:DUF4430 domain-containing protein [Romboutsia weinsteinii]|nr:DUF4430 domain-containing protein [Romboutsia weinsteinii]
MYKKRLRSIIISFMLVINLFIYTSTVSNAQEFVSVCVYSTSGALYQSVSVPYQSGDTAYSVLAKTGLGLSTTGGGGSLYVSSINGISEFDEGPASGWVYAVNGYKPDVSAGAYSVKAGDKIAWHYTVDYGSDIGSSISKLNSYVANNIKPEPKPEQKPETKPETSPESKPNSNNSNSQGSSNNSSKEESTNTSNSNNTNNSSDSKELSNNSTSSDNPNNSNDENTDKETETNDKSDSSEKSEEEKKEDIPDDLKENMEKARAAVKESYKVEINSQWEAMILSLLGEEVSKDYIETKIIKEIKANNGNYHTITELEKNLILLNILGYNTTDIEGVNLLESLITSENVEKQGSNGVIFALISLNSINEDIVNSMYDKKLDNAWSTDKLIETILSYQNEDGGFGLVKEKGSSIDITAMAISSLAKHIEDKDLKEVIDKALMFLENQYKENNGFISDGNLNSESLSQVIIALTYLDIDPSNFRGINLIEELFRFKTDENKFSHLLGQEFDNMATEQANLALIAYDKYLSGDGYLYENLDVETITTNIKDENEKIDDKESNNLLFASIGTISLCLIAYVVYRKKKNNIS